MIRMAGSWRRWQTSSQRPPSCRGACRNMRVASSWRISWASMLFARLVVWRGARRRLPQLQLMIVHEVPPNKDELLDGMQHALPPSRDGLPGHAKTNTFEAACAWGLVKRLATLAKKAAFVWSVFNGDGAYIELRSRQSPDNSGATLPYYEVLLTGQMGEALPLCQPPEWAQAFARHKLLQYPRMEEIAWVAQDAALVPPRKLGAMCGGVDTRAIVTAYGLPVVLTIEMPAIPGWPAHPKQPSKLHVLASHAPAELMRRKGLLAGDPCSLYVTESDLRLLPMAKNANEDLKLSFDPTEYITFADCEADEGLLAWYTVNMEALKVVAAAPRFAAMTKSVGASPHLDVAATTFSASMFTVYHARRMARQHMQLGGLLGVGGPP
ncbi:hypothetical protein ACK3TF_001337 [Chlorella vulgaris]